VIVAPRSKTGSTAGTSGPPLHYPLNKLRPLAEQLRRAERAKMRAAVGGDTEDAAFAALRRLDILGQIDDERGRAADSLLSMLALAIELRPHELAELLASALDTPQTRAALVPIFERLLRPTVEWLRGEQTDLAERVADLEAVMVEGVTA
jgi:hypothetical protein